jgi:hypothetical protein
MKINARIKRPIRLDPRCVDLTATRLDLPIAPGVRMARTITLGQIATQQTANHCATGAQDHEWNACCKPACEVRKEEDTDSRIHQDRQHHS